MFKIPNKLYRSYKLLQVSELAVCPDVTPEAISEFEVILNTAQPDARYKEMQSFVQFLYSANTFGFNKLIQRNKAESIILWAQPKAIVKWFNLQGKIVIKNKNGKLVVTAHKNRMEMKTKKTKKLSDKLKTTESKTEKVTAAQFKNALENHKIINDWADEDTEEFEVENSVQDVINETP